MSIINLISRKPPEICGYQFDAVLEDELDMSVEIPSYPIESGAQISDHRIIKPIKYRITGIVSNKPMNPNSLGYIGSLVGGVGVGALSNLTKNPLVASVAGLSIGFLSGSDGTRASSALERLIQILEGEEPFDVDAGDIQLKNMCVTRIRRMKNPDNENALVFELDLAEFVSLDRITSDGQPSHEQLKDGSVEQSGISAVVSKGWKNVKETASSTLDKIKGFF